MSQAVRLIFAMMFLANSSLLQASTLLKGAVLLNNSSGLPMSGVQVSTRGAISTSSLTGSLGSFQLSFPQHKPGDTVALVVAKEGYAVVNDIQLERELPSDPSQRTVLILISKAHEREQWAEQFYRIKGRETVEKSYAKKVAKAPEAQMDRLRTERDHAIRQADELAKQLSRFNPALTSSTYGQAARLFLDGKIDDALKVLSSEALDLEAKRIRLAAAETAAAYQLKARLHSIRLQWREAQAAYESAVEFAPTSYSAWFEYGQFHLGQTDYVNAERAYSRSVQIAAAKEDICRTALAKDNLGIVQRRMNRLPEAIELFDAALADRRRLSAGNKIFMPQVASTLNNLGIAYWADNEPSRAIELLDEAIQLWKSTDVADAFSAELATSLNNRGVVLRLLRKYDEAAVAYEEALAIRRRLLVRYGDLYSASVSSTLNNLGALHNAKSEPEVAISKLIEAIEIRRKLAEKNPASQQAELATSLVNLGESFRISGNYQVAKTVISEALTIRQALSRQSKEAFLDAFRQALVALAQVEREMGNFGAALDLMAGAGIRNTENCRNLGLPCDVRQMRQIPLEIAGKSNQTRSVGEIGYSILLPPTGGLRPSMLRQIADPSVQDDITASQCPS